VHLSVNSIHSNKPHICHSENLVEIEPSVLRTFVSKILENDECRYPMLALRILLHIITEIDANGRVYISARQLSKAWGIHYDTVTKCIKFLRSIEVLRMER